MQDSIDNTVYAVSSIPVVVKLKECDIYKKQSYLKYLSIFAIKGWLPRSQLDPLSCSVQTHLDNSTKYHLQQSQRHQIKQYLTIGTKFSSQALSYSHAQPPGITPPLRNGHMSPVAESCTPNGTVSKILTVGNNHENEMDDVIDDIISLESSFNDDGLNCTEPTLLMPNNVRVILITKISGKM
ncbi:unnamed protein product [Ranitomeya imitator]|uniref:MiT/TFE transcription factors N-terminal domain-containing protein n=1 Tax=Ranitomeya imitator TaxID=111125 RepID=A0ABN9LGA1_9NEOB|nr:unnamed protein product [Ranitomeya imitator]